MGNVVVFKMHPIAVHNEYADRVIFIVVIHHLVVLGIHEMERVTATACIVARDQVVPDEGAGSIAAEDAAAQERVVIGEVGLVLDDRVADDGRARGLETSDASAQVPWFCVMVLSAMVKVSEPLPVFCKVRV